MIYLSGQDYKDLRSHIAPNFTPKALSTYTSLQQLIILKHLESWERLSAPAQAESISLRNLVRDMNLETSQTVFVGRYLSSEARERFRVDYNVFKAGLLTIPFDMPGFAFRKAKLCCQRMVKMLIDCAAQSKSRMLEGDEPCCLIDFWMQGLVRVNAESKTAPPHSTEEEIGSYLFDFLFAAQDASTSALLWAVTLLDSHPDVLRKVREEVSVKSQHRKRCIMHNSVQCCDFALSDSRLPQQLMKAILRKDGCLAAINERPVDFADDIKWNEMDGNAMANFHLALADELTSLSCKIGEQERVELLLQSLPDSYDQLIINLTNSNVTSLVFDDVAAAVLQEENWRKNKEDRQVNLQQAEALITMTTMRGRSTECGQSSSHKYGRSKSRSKKNLKCYNCGKKGHLKKDCWSLNKNSNPQGNTANTSDDGDALCCEASTTYEPVSGGSVYSCNDHALEIIGVETIKLKMYDGTIKVVRDVRHVKGLKKNLLSYGLLDNNASKIETRKGIMKVFRGAFVVLKGEKIATNLYMLKGETLLEVEASVASCSSDSAMLWHQKLGHMSEQGMKVLVEQKLLPGLTKISLPLCEHCITSNQHRLKFNTSNSRGKNVLELVHSDVWRCWVYPIKKKSDVFSTFKIFKARVELDSGNKIKCFRTDNGEEYTSEEFDDFCRKEGIKRQFTVANTPQQNRVAERMNRTLLERTRAMLRDTGLEKSFWAEAVNTAYYLVNQAPSTAIELKTPMEMWTGKPADYSNLHIFESIVYVMYNSQEISKLDPKSRKCKLLGYADGVKGCRLWDPTVHKVIISRDVIFVEDKLQRKEDDDSTKKSETTHIHVEKKVEQGDSSEAEPAHDEQEPESSEAPTTQDGEPSTYQEAINSSDASLWMMAMQEEIEALHKNNTWDLVPLPQGRKPIEEIYMLQPEGFEEKEKKKLVCRLNKSLYGLKQAPRCWYKRFDSFIMCLGYNRLNSDPCAYFKREFEMKDLGSANKILGMQIHRDRSNRKIWLSQKNYLKKILSRFSMQDCKPISTPLPINFKLSSSMSPSSEEERMEMSRVPYASAVGSLMFAMICTRPDIAQAVGVVSQYMANPDKEHWNTVKRILRYIKGTSNVALCYGGSNLLINGYVDSNYAGDLDKSKSTIGYVFKVAGGAVSWVSKLQSVVATSTTEAEYVAATQASKEAIWLKMLLEELGHNQEYVSLFCDSQSALHLARNPAFHSRTKHIRVQYHFIREKVEEGTVDMQKIHTKDNILGVDPHVACQKHKQHDGTR
ncbi:CYP710A2 protein [Hibiscus syriacus]|uniref:CYP710A2 protein n=1 Tax=Hibiscus syriacus TaxID=106335 RepID=A0A6A2ZD04_HIBSY|nr:CYP710A2 protein [Hibiscus syriacus]